jgi:RimJ/RimL family protein N-acetyltransferase
VLEKAGFVYEGRMRKAASKNGRTFDLLLYALVADEPAGQKRRSPSRIRD